MILLAGGVGDPNVAVLRARLRRRGVPYLSAIGGEGRWPRWSWSLDDDRLELDGRGVRPTGVFVRFDVFAEQRDGHGDGRRRARDWYYAVLAWTLAHPEVAMANRGFGAAHLVKPHVLVKARAAGLALASTVVTNDTATLAGRDADGWILKPVDGGAHAESLGAVCRDAAERDEFARAPAILQRRLVAPDLRVFRVGDAWFAFALWADAVDYRAAARVRLERVAPEPALVEPLTALTDELGLDFAAADFKRCPDTSAFRFLEINSAPMFAAFDQRAEGAIADALVDRLVPSGASRSQP